MIKKVTHLTYEIACCVKLWLVELALALWNNPKEELRLAYNLYRMLIIRSIKLFSSIIFSKEVYRICNSQRIYLYTNGKLFIVPENWVRNGVKYFLVEGKWVRGDSILSKPLTNLNPIRVSKSGKIYEEPNTNLLNNKDWLEVLVDINSSGKLVRLVIERSTTTAHFNKFIKSVLNYLRAKAMVYKPLSLLQGVVLYYVNLVWFVTKHLNGCSVSKKYDSAYTNKPLLLGNRLGISPSNSELITSVLSLCKRFIIGFLLSLLVVSSMFFLRDIPVNKFLFAIGSVGLFTYLLLSGFVFFIKKYRYGKYTTAMHRFWRRSFSIFWALEGFLFVVFLYLTILANQEPFFMYDNIQFFRNYSYSWRYFLSENFLVLVIVALIYYTLIRQKDMIFSKSNIFIIITSLIYFNLTYLEFYQFYYTVSFYNPTLWAFDYEDNKWTIDFETTQTRRTRVMIHFITICLIAKFWHFVFIAVFWLFSVTRWLQLNSISYQLLGSNLQNAIILYLLNWILMFPWLKVVFRKFLYRHYKWLYVNFRSNGIRILFYDVSLYIYSIPSQLISIKPSSSLSKAWVYLPKLSSDSLLSDAGIFKLI